MATPGYPRASGDPGYSEQHLFYVRAAGTALDSALPFETRGYTWTSRKCAESRLWRIQSRERGVLRELTGGTQDSLTRAQVESRLREGSGAGEFVDLQGQAALEVSVSSSRGTTYTFRADANQSIEVYGSCVSASVLVGTPFGLVAPRDTVTLAAPSSTSQYVDALVGVDFQTVDKPLTQENIFFTQVVALPANVATEITIPERAVGVEIVTDQTTAAWGLFVGDTSTAANQTRSVAFVGGVAEVDIGNETVLQTDTAGGARQCRLRWTIKP